MKSILIKILAISLILILILNIILMIFDKISMLLFWLIIIISALIAYKFIPLVK